jgi:hypothetical protein
MPDQSFTLGEHEADIRALIEGQGRIERDIAAIKDTLAERKGERRMVVWLVGGASTLASVIVSYILSKH